MAFEDLLKNGQNPASPKAKLGSLNFSASLAASHHDQVLKREELLQSIMIAQGEYDYLALEIKVGKKELLDQLLEKKSVLLEKNIIFINLTNTASVDDLGAVNRQSDQLTKYRMELEAIKQSQKNQSQYTAELLQEIDLGVDLEGTMVVDPQNYLTVMSEKLKFGGIVDQGRVSRLCGFASLAAKNGDLILALKSYSIAGIISGIRDDFKKIIKKAKKEKNSQSQAAEDLLNNLTPKNNKK